MKKRREKEGKESIKEKKKSESTAIDFDRPMTKRAYTFFKIRHAC
jgi:hypothetical protein